MQPQFWHGLKAIILVLMFLSLADIRIPNQINASGNAAKNQKSRRLPIITAKNAARLSRLATIIPPTDTSSTNPIWSPDGKYLAVSGLDAIRLFDVSDFTAKPRLIYQPGAGEPTFSPDGALLAVVNLSQDRSVHVFQVKTGQQLYMVRYLGGVRLQGPVDPIFSPDGSFLAVTNGFQPYILDAHTGKIIATYPGQNSLTFSPDGYMVAAIESEAFQSAVVISETRTSERLTGFRINRLSAYTLAFSSGGDALAIDFLGNDIVVFDIASGKELGRVSPGYQDAPNLSFSPDGAMLAAFGGGKSFLWNLTTGHHAEFDYSDYDRYGGTFNKDGSLLLYWDYNENKDLPHGNLLRVWSIPEQRQVRLLEGARDPQFSPDGTMLVTWGESGLVVWAVQQSEVTF